MQRRMGLLWAAIACVVLVACDSAEERAEGHYESALALIAEGDFDRAEVEFRNVFDLNGQHRDARAAYANMLLQQDKLGAANAQFLRLAEQYPDDVEARTVLTRLALNRQHWEEVERHSKKLREIDSDAGVLTVADVALSYRDASLEQDTAAQDAVASEARALLADFPDMVVLNFISVQQAMNDGDTDLALSELEQVLKSMDDNVELHLMKLRLLSDANRIDEIEAELILLIEKFPDQAEFLPTLLQFYANQGRADDAVAYLRGYVDANPSNTEASNTLIELILQTEGADAAIAEVDKRLAGEGDQVILATQRARLVFQSGERAAGIAAVEEIVAGAEPDERINSAKLVLARMLLSEGNEVGARRQIEEIIANDGTNTAALKMQAQWLIDDDNPDEAVNLLRTAIDNAPEDWNAMLLMADAFARGGNHELSRDFVSLAVDTSNNAPEPTLRFADLLIAEDRLLIAEETLVSSLRQAPDNLQLLTKLGQVQVRREDWARVEQIEQTLRRIGTDEAQRISTGLEVARLAGQERLDEAMTSLEGLASSDSSAQTVAAVVRARLGSGNREGALDLARTAAGDNPDDLALQMILASTLLGVGEVDEGEAAFEAIVAKNDQVEGAWTALIRIATLRGDEAARDAVMERALDAMPNSIGLGWAKASVLTAEGDAEGAIAIYEDLYERSSQSPLIANNLATLLATIRDDEESLERAYTVARRLRGSEVPAFQDTYGWITLRRGDVGEAIEYLEPAAAALTGDPSVQYHLGVAYLQNEQKALALRQFQTAAAYEGDTAQFPEVALAAAEAEKLVAEGITPAE